MKYIFNIFIYQAIFMLRLNALKHLIIEPFINYLSYFIWNIIFLFL